MTSKRWRVFVKNRAAAAAIAGGVGVDVEQQTELAGVRFQDAGDVRAWVELKWKHLVFVRAEQIVPDKNPPKHVKHLTVTAVVTKQGVTFHG
jgi:hypothetical protein